MEEAYPMRKFLVTVNGGSYEVQVEEIGGAQRVAPAAAPAPAPAAAPAAPAAPTAAPAAAAAGGEKITAPMPGNILSVKAAIGATVKAGDIILILEAMKMENEILAPVAGKIAQVATKGTTVNTGDILAVIQ